MNLTAEAGTPLERALTDGARLIRVVLMREAMVDEGDRLGDRERRVVM